MKAAWTCRACCRRLQASQKSRTSLQDAALRQLPLSRSLTSEASVASHPTAEFDPQSPVSPSTGTGRFAQKQLPSRPPAPTQQPCKSTDKRPEDLFETAFKERRHLEDFNLLSPKHGRRRKSNSKIEKQTANHVTLDVEFETTSPTIPEGLDIVKLGVKTWRSVCAQIRSGDTPEWFSTPQVRWVAELEWEDIRKLWARSTTEQRDLLWETLILVTVLKHPQKTPTLLQARLMESGPTPRRYVVNDVLQFMLNYLQKTKSSHNTQREFVEQVHRLTLRFLRISPSAAKAIRPSTLGRLAQHLTRAELSELLHTLKDLRVPLSVDTELKFSSQLSGLRASDEHRGEAFELMQNVASRVENLTDPKYASVITTLLHQKFLGEKSGFDTLQALQYFMERGFLPNAITVTAIVETLCERDDFPGAMHLMNLFTANGLRFDDKACDVLLKGAQHTGHNEHLDQALSFSKSIDAPQSLLAKHALHALYLRIVRETQHSIASRPSVSAQLQRRTQRPSQERPPMAEGNREAFTAMLRFYMQRYDLSPLQSLIPQTLPYFIWNHGESGDAKPWEYKSTILPLLEKQVPVPKDLALVPCTETLSLVLRAFVRSLWRPYDLMSMYSFFKHRLQDPEGAGQSACRIVRDRGTFVHDSFIMAMMQTHGLVRPALEVFADMLSNNFRDSAAGVHPPPSVYTFSIIFAGLDRHGEHKLFDDFKQIMKENGIIPNSVTTNTFIQSYASRQDMASTVSALRDLETLGYRPSRATFAAFSKLRNQKRALDMMSEIIEENKRRSLAGL